MSGHHLHVWHLDEHRVALEAHVADNVTELKEAEAIKDQLKHMLKDKFNITHSTIELEHHTDSTCDEV